MTCPQCGTALPDRANFCPNCRAPRPTPAAHATVHGRETIVPLDPRRSTTGRLDPGTRFAERYEVQSLIGEGGMGVVYAARDTATGQDLVLKLIRPERLGGEAAVGQLLAEGLTARQIRHRNVVAVYDVAQWQGQPYFTMEHVKGGSLRTWMVAQKQQRRDVPLPVAAGIIRAILAGLAEAHRLDIVHRDLKPENVLLAGDPSASDFHLKLVDFGLAHAVGGGSPDGGGFAGTLGYMAPEQKTAADVVGPSADIYSVSVILYELLMENPPQARWEPVSRQRPDVPAALDALLERGLSARPRSRPASVEEFGAELEKALSEAGRTPEPRPQPGPQPEPPPAPPVVETLGRTWAALPGWQKAGAAIVVVAVGLLANLPAPGPGDDCDPATEQCGAPPDPEPPPGREERGPEPEPAPAPDPGPESRSARRPERPPTDAFAAGTWRDGAGNQFRVEHDGVNVRAQGVIQGVGPVVITGSVTRASGASLVVATAAGMPMYGGTGPVVPGSGGLDINLTFVYPNGAPAGQTVVHMNH